MMEKSNLSTPDRVFAALGNPVRWQIVLRLAGGQALAATSVAQEFGRDFDGISKHLRLLRAAGILASRRGADRRVELYFIPEVFLRNPGQLDLGSCVISLQALPVMAPLPARERKPRATKNPKPTTPAPEEPVKVVEKVRPPVPAPEAEEEIEEEFEPQGFGEMLARTGALPLALGGNPRERHFQR